MFCFQFGKNYGIVLRVYNSMSLQFLGKYASANLTKDKSRYKKLVFEKIINFQRHFEPRMVYRARNFLLK